jgi:predicted naringenin-chalcone synthase
VNARILSIGTATPPAGMSQQEALDMARSLSPRSTPDARLTRIHRACGIEQRFVCIIDPANNRQTLSEADSNDRVPGTARRMRIHAQAAGPLAVSASSIALERAGLHAKRVTHVVYASCTGLSAPGVDQRLVWELGLNEGVARTIIGFMGCHAAINALRVAHDTVCADPGAIVLVCCTELCSPHMHFSPRPDQLIANALFADGAAAAIVADSSTPAPRIRTTASRLIPGTDDLMSWVIGDHGFEMTLGAQVPGILAREVAPWIDSVLESAGLTREGIGAWAVHPGGPKVIDAVAASLGLREEHVRASREILRRFGNMSSPTLLFILDELIRADHQRPWVGMAFGPGLAAEAIVLI